jgi:3-oxoacyl-[acyl-carrier protein] reductase
MTPGIDLTGKIALVTGASRGIGLAVARRLVEAGATVAANVRQIDDAVRDAFAGLDAIRPGAVIPLEGSVDQPEVARALARTMFARCKKVDILVNNAGVLRDSVIGMIGDEEIDSVLHTNLYSVLYLTQGIGRLMMRARNGSIINVASIIGRTGCSGHLVYGASKAGIIGATLSAAKELAPHNIRVNAVAPGFIETRMTQRFSAKAKERLVAQIGMGRAGLPEDVADVVLFLASDMSRYVPGQIIGVDGGMVV